MSAVAGTALGRKTYTFQGNLIKTGHSKELSLLLVTRTATGTLRFGIPLATQTLKTIKAKVRCEGSQETTVPNN